MKPMCALRKISFKWAGVRSCSQDAGLRGTAKLRKIKEGRQTNLKIDKEMSSLCQTDP